MSIAAADTSEMNEDQEAAIQALSEPLIGSRRARQSLWYEKLGECAKARVPLAMIAEASGQAPGMVLMELRRASVRGQCSTADIDAIRGVRTVEPGITPPIAADEQASGSEPGPARADAEQVAAEPPPDEVPAAQTEPETEPERDLPVESVAAPEPLAEAEPAAEAALSHEVPAANGAVDDAERDEGDEPAALESEPDEPELPEASQPEPDPAPSAPADVEAESAAPAPDESESAATASPAAVADEPSPAAKRPMSDEPPSSRAVSKPQP